MDLRGSGWCGGAITLVVRAAADRPAFAIAGQGRPQRGFSAPISRVVTTQVPAEVRPEEEVAPSIDMNTSQEAAGPAGAGLDGRIFNPALAGCHGRQVLGQR